MAGKVQNLLKAFGPKADPSTTFKAADIAAAMQIPLYVFNRRVLTGAFPKPDFIRNSLRAWKLKTIQKKNPELAANLLQLSRPSSLSA